MVTPVRGSAQVWGGGTGCARWREQQLHLSGRPGMAALGFLLGLIAQQHGQHCANGGVLGDL